MKIKGITQIRYTIIAFFDDINRNKRCIYYYYYLKCIVIFEKKNVENSFLDI